MIIEKYGKVKPQNSYYGQRVVCEDCGSKLIIQEEDKIKCDGDQCRHYLYLGKKIRFVCPFCSEEPDDVKGGVIYKNRFCEFLDHHDRICKVVEWFTDYGIGTLICILIVAGVIGGIGWLIQRDKELNAAYRYEIRVNHSKIYDIYWTNKYVDHGDYIDFYIKDDESKHMVVMKGDRVTINDHGVERD